eukprot:3936313-Rhodomonas_salina.1
MRHEVVPSRNALRRALPMVEESKGNVAKASPSLLRIRSSSGLVDAGILPRQVLPATEQSARVCASGSPEGNGPLWCQ